MQKKLLLLTTLVMLYSCGGDPVSTELDFDPITVVENHSDLPTCKKEQLNRFFYVTDSNSLVYCDGKKHQYLSLKGEPGKDGAKGEDGEPGKPGKDGGEGGDGTSCNGKFAPGIGMLITCGEFVDTIYSYISMPPLAVEVFIAGTPLVDSTLEGHYSYVDFEGLSESGSYYQWFRNETPIINATEKQYVIKAEDAEQEISFMVVPSNGDLPTNKGAGAISRPMLITEAKYCLENPQNCGRFTDVRDERSYLWVRIENQTWMAENLAYLTVVNAKDDISRTESRSYVYGYDGEDLEKAKSSASYKKFGALYNSPALQDLCPPGWKVPSASDFQSLVQNAGGTEVAVKTLMAKEHYEDGDNFAFKGLLSGYLGVIYGDDEIAEVAKAPEVDGDESDEEEPEIVVDNLPKIEGGLFFAQGNEAIWWGTSGTFLHHDMLVRNIDETPRFEPENAFAVRCIQEDY
ncbi:MAG: hypothetical protein GX801_05840 [Fibrobacter sp.]|nr:hypothetical protein [Fibrobacter sp.]